MENNIYGIDSQASAIRNLKKKFYSWIFDRSTKYSKGQPINNKSHYDGNYDYCLNLMIGNSLKDTFFSNVLKQGGFDIVMGNPPYIDSEEMTKSNSKLRAYCSENYRVAKGNWDIFCIFIEVGLEKYLKDGGRLAYIVPNKLLSSEYSKETRKLIQQYTIECIRDYSDIDVFGVSVYPIIIFLIKDKDITNKMVKIEKIGMKNNKGPEIVKSEDRNITYFINNDIWSISIDINKKLIDLKLKDAVKLGNWCEISGAATVSEAYKIKELLKDLENEDSTTYFKFINTGTIDKNKSLWGVKKTRYIKNKYSKPIILKNILKKKLPNRYNQADSEKIIIAGLTKTIEAIYDGGDYLAGKSTVIILNKQEKKIDLRYLTAILNSSIISYIYRKDFGNLTLKGGYLRVGPPQLRKLKLPKILLTNPNIHNEINRVLDSSKKFDKVKKIDEIISKYLDVDIKEHITN
ncbi:MAG: hypothetical protein EU549_01090 [Promethearchaeota archaeon]|nr:MAG: hypothetical protein EU549_01090 [Candidatus Lokiarchaeota archaeon]